MDMRSCKCMGPEVASRILQARSIQLDTPYILDLQTRSAEQGLIVCL